jgi:hypothetical protein
MIEAAATRGVDLSGHRSSADPVAAADVVIGFELEHVAAAVVDGGAPVERTFQLRELMELLEPLPQDDPRAMIAAAHESRRAGPPRVYASVADPFGGSRKDYERAAAEMAKLLDRLSERLGLGLRR